MFVGFLVQIEKSQKLLPKQLLETIRHDVRSITGRNIKHLEQISGGQLYKHQKFGLYAEVLKENAWKIKTVKERIDVRFGNLEVINFTSDEL